MPGEARQAVRRARLWGANMKGVGGTICQPSLCPLRPLGQCWALKPSSPSAHLNPHDNRSRPYYSSRLAGGYLLSWQPAYRRSRKLAALFCARVLAWFDSAHQLTTAWICISITTGLPSWRCVFKREGSGGCLGLALGQTPLGGSRAHFDPTPEMAHLRHGI